MTTTATTNTTSGAVTGALTGQVGARNPRSVLGKEDFLKLLVAQLKNQDPQSPMNADQMAAQLAQFSSVEQLVNIAQSLDRQQQMQSSLLSEVAASGAVQTIGKVVTASSDTIKVGEGGTEQLMVRGTGAPATVTLVDPVTGTRVYERFLGPVSPGAQSFDVARALPGAPTGTWRVTVTAQEGSETTPLATGIRAVATGIVTAADGLKYVVGGLTVPLNAVSGIAAR